MAATPQISLRVGSLGPALQARGGENAETVRTLAERYLYALQQELRAVSLTEAEALLILDAANGTLWEPHSAGLLWAEVDDSLADGLAEKWDVDGPALVAKLKALTYTQSLAVVDACEVWGRQYSQNEDRKMTLHAVGLVHYVSGEA